MKERLRRPAFAIAFNGEIGTGSGRSIQGVDLGRAVRAAVEKGLLAKGGGHAMAAGVTIEKARLGEFRAFMEETLSAAGTRPRRRIARHRCGADGLGRVELAQSIDRAGPFGSATEPALAFPAHRIVDAGIETANGTVGALRGEGSAHAIAFRAGGTLLGDMLLKARDSGPLHLAGTPVGRPLRPQ